MVDSRPDSENDFPVPAIALVLGVSILKFSRRGRVAAIKILGYLPLWPRGCNPPNNPYIQYFYLLFFLLTPDIYMI